MPKAVQLTAYGGRDRITIVDVPQPEPGPGEIVVRVVAAGTNPGEVSIREGLLKDMYPRDFPFGQGADFAGHVESVGAGAGAGAFAPGDEVFGWTDQRSAQAHYVRSDGDHVVRKPPNLDWYRAGSLFVAGSTATAAVRAVDLQRGDVVAISGAAGGVGSLAVQLARHTGAHVIGIASDESAAFLRSVGVEHVTYGDGLGERLKALAPHGLDAFLDFFGGGYVDTAVALGVAPSRINTIIDFAGAKTHGTKADGSAEAATREVLADLGERIAWGEIVAPLWAIYPFAMVRDAYAELERRKTHGKIVLALDPAIDRPLRASR